MAAMTKSNSRLLSARPRVKLWLESRGESFLCGGMNEILNAVAKTGSVKQAAASVGRSYRFVWARIKEAEASLGATLVETRVGGTGTRRSQLSPLAADLLRDFDELRQEVFKLVDGEFGRRVTETLRRHGR